MRIRIHGNVSANQKPAKNTRLSIPSVLNRPVAPGTCLPISFPRNVPLSCCLSVSLWVWWMRTIYESSPPSPTWFCSFWDHLHLWKNWITAPVAGQRNNKVVAFFLFRSEAVPWQRQWAGGVLFGPFWGCCTGNVFSVLLPWEPVYRAVAPGTWLLGTRPTIRGDENMWEWYLYHGYALWFEVHPSNTGYFG
jgi:hypothetical protein